MSTPGRLPNDRAVDLGIPGYTDAIEIGRGGFGVVYRAYQPDFNRTVAIKLLLGGRLDEQSRQRFDRERRIMGVLSDHPNIVTVFGWGFTPGDNPYIAMAYMARGSLADRLEGGPLGWQEATLTGVKLCRALEAAHQAKVLHRDLKPENVLVSAYGEPTLADFGIARVEGGIETVGGTVTASVAHAAPEILSGQRPTVASDVYGLGSTILTLILGRPPFLGQHDESIVPMMARIGSDPVPDARPQGVPDSVCRAIERAMAKGADRRPSSAAHFGRELQQALDRASRANPRQTVVATPRVARAPSAHPPPPPPLPGPRRASNTRPEADQRGEGVSGKPRSAPQAPAPRGNGSSGRITKEPAHSSPAPVPLPPPTPSAPEPAATKGGKTIAIVIAIMVIALVVLGAAVFL